MCAPPYLPIILPAIYHLSALTMPPKKSKSESLYPTVIWSANNKRLIWMIFTVLEEDDTIRRGIWPRKGDTVSGKSKATHYKNLAQKVLATEPEFYPIVTQNDGKAATHFGKSVKNQLSRLEKGFKEARTNLGVTGGGLPNEDAIWQEGEIRDKWEEVKLTCPWYFRMKVLVEDRFDDIGAAITNSGEEIDMDLMGDSRKRAHTEALGEIDQEDNMEDDTLGMYKILIYKGY